MSVINIKPPSYTLSPDDQVKFDRMWLEEIQFFKEVPWHNINRSNKAKEFAAKVYALSIEKTKKPKI